MRATFSLSEIEFPPHSGGNVAFDSGGAITIFFDTPVLDFGAFFTYAQPMNLLGFDSSGVQVDSALSLFSANFTSSGNSPNEFLHVRSPGGISSVSITGDPGGGSFVVDDLTLTTADSGPGSPEPEPATVALTLIGLAAVVLRLWRRSLSF